MLKTILCSCLLLCGISCGLNPQSEAAAMRNVERSYINLIKSVNDDENILGHYSAAFLRREFEDLVGSDGFAAQGSLIISRERIRFTKEFEKLPHDHKINCAGAKCVVTIDFINSNNKPCKYEVTYVYGPSESNEQAWLIERVALTVEMGKLELEPPNSD